MNAWGGPRSNSGGPRPNAGGYRPGAGRKRIHAHPLYPVGKRWYVVETRPKCETILSHEMAQASYRAYLPMIATRRSDKGPALVTIEPMFRGYLFAEIDIATSWADVAALNGFRAILKGAGGKPLPLPPDLVPALMAHDTERLGLIDSPNTPHASGRSVCISAAPFEGIVGRVINCDGLTTTVQISLFGRSMPIKLNWLHVRAL